MIDRTERPIQLPQDQQKQKGHYSGKKKASNPSTSNPHRSGVKSPSSIELERIRFVTNGNWRQINW